MLKVAFVGTHGVGKTTIVEGLKNELGLSDANVVEETAARVFEMGKDNPALRINQGATLEAQLHILGLQLEEENAKCKELSTRSDALLLCDRTVFDALIYTQARVSRDSTYPWATDLCRYLHDWVFMTLRTPYDLVFYLPVSFPLQSSEVRPADTEFQEEMDKLIQAFFFHKQLGNMKVGHGLDKLVKKIVVLSGTPERRVEIAKEYIEAEKADTKYDNYASALMGRNGPNDFLSNLARHMQTANAALGMSHDDINKFRNYASAVPAYNPIKDKDDE